MDEMWKVMREIEASMEKLHRSMFSSINRSLNSIFDEQEMLPLEKNFFRNDAPARTFRFYARRETDSTGRDVREVYMEMDGEKRYWKKDGDKELLIEPNKYRPGKNYFERMKRKLLPGSSAD
ncbi:hypothetical protein JOC37_000973 [Desulfohalotomaculum tongense]|uniref:hypothetical protein n=1 Tax=Desulforadius tongensis TaxID=1216062 RepID=UPI00195676C0|nr:hypothetical protein [Desulforadius tongensis]MBM7854600.1 hypothetical protein [Desulforadius tongensis]